MNQFKEVKMTRSATELSSRQNLIALIPGSIVTGLNKENLESFLTVKVFIMKKLYNNSFQPKHLKNYKMFGFDDI